jgi:hypothetical protein
VWVDDAPCLAADVRALVFVLVDDGWGARGG